MPSSNKDGIVSCDVEVSFVVDVALDSNAEVERDAFYSQRRVEADHERGNLDAFGEDAPIFHGAGDYDCFIPASLARVRATGEAFAKLLVEFCETIGVLTGAVRVRAAAYREGSALVRACRIACLSASRPRVLVADSLHPDARRQLDAYAAAGLFKVESFADLAGLDALLACDPTSVACVVCSFPNFYGSLESVSAVAERARKVGASTVVALNDLVAAAAVKPACELGADIVVGDARPFVESRRASEPTLGFIGFAPGFEPKLSDSEIAATAVKADALDARSAEFATTYYAKAGMAGIADASRRARKLAVRARKALAEAGFQFHHDAPFVREFAVKVADPKGMNAYLARWGVGGGRLLDDGMILAFTEKHAEGEIDELVYLMTMFQFGESAAQEGAARAEKSRKDKKS